MAVAPLEAFVSLVREAAAYTCVFADWLRSDDITAVALRIPAALIVQIKADGPSVTPICQPPSTQA